MRALERTRHVLGIDLGTSSLKALLLREDGSPVGTATRAYPIAAPYPGWAEQDPRAWWTALCGATHDILVSTGAPAESVRAIAVGGQMHGLTLLDGRGEPLRAAIIWPDQRSTAEARAIDAVLERHGLVAALGGGVSPGFMLPSLAWLRMREPALWRDAAHALLPKDYLRYRLTGAIASEPSDASGIPLVDLASWRWREDAREFLDLPARLFPPLLASNAVAGTVTAAAATETGLRAGTPVLCGGSDQAMGAIGAGVLEPGALLVSLSTGGQIVAPVAHPLERPIQGARTLCHAVPGVYLALAATLGAGLSLRWMRERLSAIDGPDAEARFVDLAGEAPPGAGGLIFLPYLAGERAPLLDPEASGALVGLRLDQGAAHIARATLEGVVFGLRHALDLLESLGARADRVVLAGGAARNPLVRQIAADVFDRPVEGLQTAEQSALGAAVLATVGAGFYPDLRAACDASVTSTRPIAPDPTRARLYSVLYGRYRGLYPALRDDMRALRQIGGTLPETVDRPG